MYAICKDNYFHEFMCSMLAVIFNRVFNDRRKGGKTKTVMPTQLGQLKTEPGRQMLLGSPLGGPDDLARLWDRIE